MTNTNIIPNYPMSSGQNETELASSSADRLSFYINFQYPVLNERIDNYGVSQPRIPPMEIAYVECRHTSNVLAVSSPNNPSIGWKSTFKEGPSGPCATLQNPSLPWNIDTNNYIGLKDTFIVKNVKPRTSSDSSIVYIPIYYQLRFISRSNEISEWSKLGVFNFTKPKSDIVYMTQGVDISHSTFFHSLTRPYSAFPGHEKPITVGYGIIGNFNGLYFINSNPTGTFTYFQNIFPFYFAYGGPDANVFFNGQPQPGLFVMQGGVNGFAELDLYTRNSAVSAGVTLPP